MIRNFSTQRIFSKLVFFTALAVIAVGIGWLWNRAGTLHSSSKLQVIAAENMWGDIASQLGGDQVQVTSLIHNSSVDPHEYEATPADSAMVASADVVIENGLGYDDFMTKLIAATNTPNQIQITVANVLDASEANANPHLWYDTLSVPTVAQAISQTYQTKDPAHAAFYKQRLSEFNRSLIPLTSLLETMRTQKPNKPVAYTERVSEYMVQAAGANVLSPTGFMQAVEDGSDPSPADTLAMESLLTQHQVRMLLYNMQTGTPATEHIRAVAEANKIPVVEITETLPTNSTYQEWQLKQIEALYAAIK